MFIFPSKNRKQSGILSIIVYLLWAFLILACVFFSWIFLFVYRHLYAVTVQEAAIISLKSDLIVTKVDRPKFDAIVNAFEQKKTPLISINFEKLKNPFELRAAAPK
ncbi:MAG: hypothetical protein V1661_02305 [bacterium]